MASIPNNSLHNSLEQQLVDPTDALLASLAEVEVQEDLVRERQLGINAIHRDVVHVRGLFQEVAYHVEHQGRLLDNIEANVSTTVDASSIANQELRRGVEYTRRSTKQSFCILLGLVITSILFVLVLRFFL